MNEIPYTSRDSGGFRISQQGPPMRGFTNLLFGQISPKTAWQWRKLERMEGPKFYYVEAVTDPRKRQGRTPPFGSNSFSFMQFSAQIVQNNRLAHPSEVGAYRNSWICHWEGIHDAPCTVFPGSAFVWRRALAPSNNISTTKSFDDHF